MSILLTRYLEGAVRSDLQKRMVFLGGPRQSGKTTLAQSLLDNYKDGHPAYLNWDLERHRQKIRNHEWPASEKFIIFDEIHKHRNWRNLVKGIYDTLRNTHSFIITGSARLDHCRKGGDSLLGRYYYYRLHPFSLPEVGISEDKLNRLFTYGGFPEAFLRADKRYLRKWHQERLAKIVKQDLRDLESVKDIDKVELLAEELPRRIGSPLSVNSLSQDLEVDPKTTKRWLGILDALYYCFQIAPLGSPQIRAVKKEQKLYLWDWSQIEEPGIRFENMMACQLLKYCHFHEDVDGYKMELRYLRDTDKREVDFVVLKNKKPCFAVECKLKATSTSPHIFYFRQRTSIKTFYQVSLEADNRQVEENISLTSFADFCRREKMV